MRQNGFTADPAAVLRAIGNPLFLRKLQRFRVGGAATGERSGQNRKPQAAQAHGLEVASYRAYVPGDDLRHFDWNAYGRLGEKVIKTFVAEREAPLHLLIDTSASMDAPATDAKWATAVGVVASLAYVSLRRHDPVRIIGVGQPAGEGPIPIQLRHPGRFDELRTYLAGLRPGGPTMLVEGVSSYLRSSHLGGLAVLLSDFLVPAHVYERALEALIARGHDVAALRLIGPQERHPNRLSGRVQLRDPETGSERLIDVTKAHREQYQTALAEHLDALRSWCASHRVTHGVVNTDDGIEECVLNGMSALGLLR